MTKFEQAIQDALQIVDHDYAQFTSNCYEITPENLKHLIETVCLSVIYNPKLQEEIYESNN